MSFLFLCFLVTSSILSALFLLILRKKAHQPMMFINKSWAYIFTFLGGIRIVQHNKEILNANIPCIVVGNHGSNMDMFIGAYCMPLKVKPLAKIQLKKIPLLGFLFSTVCILVDRSSKESRERSGRYLMEEIRKGAVVYIYPEGTRNKGDKPVNAFFDGAFRFAIEGKTKIVAMCTVNARKIVPSDSYWIQPGTIHVHYLGPYDASTLQRDDLEDFKMRIYNDMYNIIGQHDRMFSAKLKS